MNRIQFERPLPFPSSEWTTVVEADPCIDGGCHYHADLYRAGVWVCRVALAGRFADRTSAEEALSRRLHSWLVDYEARPHTGDTGFQILE